MVGLLRSTNFQQVLTLTNRKAAKRFFANVAADMDQYVHRIETELPLFSKHLKSQYEYVNSSGGALY